MLVRDWGRVAKGGLPTFYVEEPLLWNGELLGIGQLFATDSIPYRRIRLLYEARKISPQVAKPQPVAKQVKKNKK